MSLKIHNFLISYPILLKLFFIGLSDFSGSIESKLFLEWTWALMIMMFLCYTVCLLPLHDDQCVVVLSLVLTMAIYSHLVTLVITQ